LLFSEAFNLKDGRQAVVDRLAEYFLILLRRSAIASRPLQAGILLALSDDHLSKAFQAIHEQPERSWTLEELSRIAGMSRARLKGREEGRT
jgi:transcriptional regulator GlxA family with amidase domain